MTEPDDGSVTPRCIRCGECCEPFIMDEELVEEFRGSFQRSVLRQKHFPHISAVLVETADNKCVFLLPDNTCSIYQSRPEFPCRMFGIPGYLECPKVTPDGRLRSKEEHDMIVAKNTDRSQWSEEYKRKLDELMEQRLRVIMKKNDCQ